MTVYADTVASGESKGVDLADAQGPVVGHVFCCNSELDGMNRGRIFGVGRKV